VLRRPLYSRPLNERGNRIQVVSKGAQPKPHAFERNAAASGRWIEHNWKGNASTFCFVGNPNPLAGGGHVREGALVTVRIWNTLCSAARSIYFGSRPDRVTVNPKHVHEPLPIRDRRQQRC